MNQRKDRGTPVVWDEWWEKEAMGLIRSGGLFGMPLREQSERTNEVGCGDVGICTYLYLFSDQSASVFDPTRSSFSIVFK